MLQQRIEARRKNLKRSYYFNQKASKEICPWIDHSLSHHVLKESMFLNFEVVTMHERDTVQNKAPTFDEFEV